jgi:hypothetical protein
VDNQQIRQILSAYRPGVDDADSQVAEALALARRDATLSRWLDEQIAMDTAIRAKLRDLPAPIGLKTRLLANAPAARPVRLWAWLAPAAAALIAIVVGVLWLHPHETFAAYRADMAKFVSAKYDLDLHSENFDDLRQNFAKNGYPSDYVLPPGLKQLHVEGGCLRQWHGHKVALVCLEAKDHDVWLFVEEKAKEPDAPCASPVFAKDGKITTASWSEGHLTYVLATEGDDAELKSYLQPATAAHPSPATGSLSPCATGSPLGQTPLIVVRR